MCHFGVIRGVQVMVVAVSLAGGAVGAHAEVSLGASFGYTHLSYPDLPNFSNNIFGVPGSEAWSQPGFRIGYVAPSRRWDLNADIGLVHRSGPIFSDQTAVELLPQVQANARSRGGLSPFLNGGVGIRHETALLSATHSVTGTRPVFGVGIGLRKTVSDDHGFVRVELRYDHLLEQVKDLGPGDTFTFPATNLFSVKLGFDLVVGR